ncbi:hypothetical protein OIV83_003928 [Microbotryomycetes sp. JL201]|nr:hypothetical protein OIV83_003928 [Microbotryomycetes sp. JL201]
MSGVPLHSPGLVTEPAPIPRSELASQEFVETRSVTLEWKVSNLKQLFESSQGTTKSKCVKSALFDNHRWQVFLYPNSGHEQYMSLYLSCEPTQAEKERGLAEQAAWAQSVASGSAIAPGTSSTAGANTSSGAHEQAGVAFSSSAGASKSHALKDGKGPWRREGKFKFTFEPAVRVADAFLIVCTIVYSPTPPSPPPLPRLLIPPDLVSAYASLFDDPLYSDVVFRIRPARRPRAKERRLYAAKKILAGRSEYFEAMFTSGFNESSIQMTTVRSRPPSQFEELDDDGNDFEDEDDDEDEDWDDEDSDAESGDNDEDRCSRMSVDDRRAQDPSVDVMSGQGQRSHDEGDQDMGIQGTDGRSTPERPGQSTFVDAPVAPDSPTKPAAQRQHGTLPVTRPARPHVDSRPRFEVIVTDAGYQSYRALLRYLYTDSITFAPLSSNYHVAREAAAASGVPFPFKSKREYLLANTPFASTATATTTSGSVTGLPPNASTVPCSAKEMYRLADKLGLTELKDRAFEHIVKNLTVQNIPLEVFGSFASQFEEVKRVEIAFLLDRWNEAKGTQSMRRVFEYLRTGKFPGKSLSICAVNACFESVFFKLLENLEFVPRMSTGNEDEDRA